MGYVHSATIDHPLEEVFAWHCRPGAIHRLVPPWQPVRVAEEAASLESGSAVLALPAGLRWVARHRPDGYEPGRKFTDELVTPVLGTVVGWRHEHVFSAAGTGATTVTDRVATRVPPRFLREMFAYRTRQLRDDLDSQRDLNRDGRHLSVAVTGSGGLIGNALCAYLSTAGHRVVRLTRSPGGGTGTRHWDPAQPAPDLLDGIDAVVHLAGESIAGRFNRAHKEAVRDSRVEPTRRLAELAARRQVGVFVSASAVGFYGSDRGEEEVDESAGRGGGFLADVVEAWEAAAATAATSATRVVMVRTGIVQSPRGGALALQRLLFEAGLGGRLGSGRQWLSWVGIDDMVDIYARALLDASIEGPLNAVTPEPVRNDEFTSTLGRVLHRPTVLAVPSFAPALLLGREGAAEVAEASQKVKPAKLEKAGHRFRHARLEPALRHLLGRTGAAE